MWWRRSRTLRGGKGLEEVLEGGRGLWGVEGEGTGVGEEGVVVFFFGGLQELLVLDFFELDHCCGW